ncbi:hypothetical protein SAMN02745866_02050 [Alteromonadaceae bacterium Bs31]|nr:hypothetical protein SAMN02745866_02050 [Alteromonadaceae bacterium Bs31]
MSLIENEGSTGERGFFGRRIAKVKSTIAGRIREKAIERATTRIYLHGRRPEDYDEDVLEVIVKEEEDKLKSEFKDKGILVLLAALGLSFWS